MDKINISVYIDGDEYGDRLWGLVPRTGDYMAVNGRKKGIYKVAEVIWTGDDRPEVIVTLKDEPTQQE